MMLHGFPSLRHDAAHRLPRRASIRAGLAADEAVIGRTSPHFAEAKVMAARERGSSHLPRIPPAVARKLGNYVYLYSNPLDDSIFYVGKGRGNRALAHLNANERKEISKKIEEIRARERRRYWDKYYREVA